MTNTHRSALTAYLSQFTSFYLKKEITKKFANLKEQQINKYQPNCYHPNFLTHLSPASTSLASYHNVKSQGQ